ncbi:hypothetical protein ACHAWF_011683 [Thalassiosira exigua]
MLPSTRGARTSTSPARARRSGPPRRASPGEVFSTADLAAGDEIISIPYYATLTQDNAARYFPSLEGKLLGCREKRRGRLKRLWDRIRRRPARADPSPDDYWQAELTAYALEAVDSDHPWSTWVKQWRRDDPIQDLVGSAWREDDGAIEKATSAFHAIAPAVPELKIGAALGIRLAELDEYMYRCEGRVPTSEGTYVTLISRAIGIADGVTAVLPVHDMIDHSKEPNAALAFGEDEAFKVVALRDVVEGEELFLSYMNVDDDGGEWDEDKAAWLLVQWDIPSTPV